MSEKVSPDAIRASFSDAVSRMYRAEVPLYGDLLEIVATVNDRTLAAAPAPVAAMLVAGDVGRLNAERHGAIRVGTAGELATMRRAFAVMGMSPVGYYDLAPAGVPVHSTAFRAIRPASLDANPFRVFTSLLRLDLIEDETLRTAAGALLSRRRIFTDRAIALIERSEREGGLAEDEAAGFVAAMLETFRWHGEALVDAATYDRLNAAHRLVADIVSFKGPHINHLTPRTLDIDAAADEMRRRGMDIKADIEGPPRRDVPILLRQTSFRALNEAIAFVGEDRTAGAHTARFGEIEQRGIALTRKGRALYDALLAEAGSGDGAYAIRLERAFARFPDDVETLRRERLAYFRYEAVADAPAIATDPADAGFDAGFDTAAGFDVDAAIARGQLRTLPLIYEDFLPVSAAGIFRSNLGRERPAEYATGGARETFEAALGAPVHDPFEIYEQIERQSLDESVRQLLRAIHPAAA